MQSVVGKNMVDSLSVPTFRVGYPVAIDALDALYDRVHDGTIFYYVFLRYFVGFYDDY